MSIEYIECCVLSGVYLWTCEAIGWPIWRGKKTKQTDRDISEDQIIAFNSSIRIDIEPSIEFHDPLNC